MKCSYNPKKSLSQQIAALSKSIDLSTSKPGHYLSLCDFNVVVENTLIKVFFDNYNLASIVSTVLYEFITKLIFSNFLFQRNKTLKGGSNCHANN